MSLSTDARTSGQDQLAKKQVAAALAGENRAIVEDLDQLLKLLHLVISGEPPSRERAVSYLNCRSRLLTSKQGSMLPGFLYQCGTIDRFREFIFLYDPDVELRGEFIDRMIGRARALCVSPTPDPREASPKPVTSPSTWDF